MFMSSVTDVFDYVEYVFNTYSEGTHCKNISCHSRELFQITVIDTSYLEILLAERSY